MDKIKLLLVEDETTLGQIVKESLEVRDFEVIYCENGVTGWNAYKTARPDVCVLDIMMPERDGFALARDIRAEDPHIPLIFLTARSQTADVVKGFEIGANDYVKKPFSMEELIVRIKALLRRQTSTNPQETAPTSFEIGHYTFEPQKQMLSFQGEGKKLTHRESELLRLLCQHQNQVLERKYVLDLLWGDDSFFNGRSMDVFITKLRKYLKHDPQIEILNVRGIGYKLVY